MFEKGERVKGERVKCIATSHIPNYFGELGTIVVAAGRRLKVLFDSERVAGRMDAGQNLANAHWYFDLELENVEHQRYEDDLWECSNCGVLRREEVKQVERDECCIEACRYCDRDAHPVQYDKTRR